MTVAEAVRRLRADPQYAGLIQDAYLGPDVLDSARRFTASAEFAEVLRLVGPLTGRVVVDLGAGTGIASWAFAQNGAKKVYALEPDSSDEAGAGAIRRLSEGLAIDVLAASGEKIPLSDGQVNLVYVRQVLHHIHELGTTLKECARILKAGGLFLACREHVVDNDAQLKAFLAAHPVHRLAGNEHAHRLDDYVAAMNSAGLTLLKTLGPWDSIINAYPAVQTPDELDGYAARLLQRRWGRAGALCACLPGVQWLVWRRLRRPVPGRLYTFLAKKGA